MASCYFWPGYHWRFWHLLWKFVVDNVSSFVISSQDTSDTAKMNVMNQKTYHKISHHFLSNIMYCRLVEMYESSITAYDFWWRESVLWHYNGGTGVIHANRPFFEKHAGAINPDRLTQRPWKMMLGEGWREIGGKEEREGSLIHKSVLDRPTW